MAMSGHNPLVGTVMIERRGSSAFEVVFRENFNAISAYVAAHHPSIDVDDIVAETFHVAWRRQQDLPEGFERAWLIGIARNVARNSARAERRRRSMIRSVIAVRPPLSTGLAAGAVEPDDVDALKAALAQLSNEDREILLLHIWEGLQGDELGVALGISKGTAAVRLHRARTRLKQQMDLDTHA
jgi:RNA polymerase sigma factor (sigma-70 family)